MALRARELYYFVRVGNYASRPLRALSADFRALSHASNQADASLERIQRRQQQLQRSIGLRRATIPAMREAAALRLEQQQIALQRSTNALATRRATINNGIIDTETKINSLIEQGNVLQTKRDALVAKQATSLAVSRRATALQGAQLSLQRRNIVRQRAAIPDQQRLAALELSRARARRAAILPSITAPAREAALAGKISNSPDIAKLQATFLGAEKAVLSAQVAVRSLSKADAELAEKQQVLAASARKLRAVEQDLAAREKQNAAAVKGSNRAITENAALVDKYRRSLQEFRMQLQMIVVDERALSVQERKLIADRIASAESIARENEAIAMEVAELKRLEVAALEATAAVNRMRWDKIALGGRTLMDLGRSAQYAGGIVLAGLGVMAHAAANFSTQVTLAATQVGNTVRQVHTATTRIQESILQQMRRFPATAEEMSKASYDIFSSLKLQGGQARQTAQGMKVLNIFNRAAVAGQTDLVDVTHAGITALNDFGKAGRNGSVNIRQLTGFMNRSFAAVRFGRMTFTEFTQALTSTAPAAKAANQTFGNMAGTLAFLTTRIPSVRTAGVAYARLLEVIQRSRQGLARRGVSIVDPETGHMKQLSAIIGDIVTKYPKLAQGKRFITEFFKSVTKGTGSTTGTQGTIQARKALVFLVQQYTQYQKILKETTGDQTEFNKSFQALSQTSGVRFKVFMNNLRATALVIGADVTPTLLKMLGPIQKALMWFNRLSDSTKNSIATFAAWTGGVLLIGGTLSVLIGMLVRSAKGFLTLGRAMRDAAIYMGLMEGEIAIIQPELLIGMGVLVAVAAIIKFHRQLGTLLNRLGITKRMVMNFWPVRWLTQALRFVAMLGRLGGALINAGRHFRRTSGIISSHIPVLSRVVDWLRKIAHWWGIVANFKPIRLVVHFISDLAKWHPPGFFGKTLGQIGGYAKTALQAGTSPLGFVVGEGTRLGNKAAKAINNAVDPINIKLKATQGMGPHHRRGGFFDDPAKRARQTAIETANAAKAQLTHNQLVQKYIALAEQAIAVARKHPKNLQDQIRMEKILDAINKKFTGAELAGINDVINADTAAAKKRVANAKRTAKAIAAATKQAANEAVSSMRQMYDQFYQQNQSAMGDITQGVRVSDQMQFGNVPTSRDLLGDIRDQVTKFERWRRELGQLAHKVPYALIQQLEAAGPTAEPIIRGLLRLTPQQLKQYKAYFNRAQTDIEAATRQDFNMQLGDWRKRGRKAALSFMRGIGDEKSYINKQMRAIFLSWLKGNTNAQLGAVAKQANPRPRHHAAARQAARHNPRPPVTHPRAAHHAVVHHTRHQRTLQSHTQNSRTVINNVQHHRPVVRNLQTHTQNNRTVVHNVQNHRTVVRNLQSHTQHHRTVVRNVQNHRHAVVNNTQNNTQNRRTAVRNLQTHTQSHRTVINNAQQYYRAIGYTTQQHYRTLASNTQNNTQHHQMVVNNAQQYRRSTLYRTEHNRSMVNNARQYHRTVVDNTQQHRRTIINNMQRQQTQNLRTLVHNAQQYRRTMVHNAQQYHRTTVHNMQQHYRTIVNNMQRYYRTVVHTTKPSVARPPVAQPVVHPRSRDRRSSVQTNHHYHDQITIQTGESDLSTMLRKARLSQKNRRVRFA